MRHTIRISSSLGLAALLSFAATAQVSPTDLTARAADASEEKLVSPSRVLSGVRGYPSEIIEALATLGGHPTWLERTATRIRENKPIEFDAADMPADVKTALSRLSNTPEIIVIAASQPQETAMLRSIQTDAPEGGAQRLTQLRVGYDLSTKQAAAAWQRALESDPVALDQYRELLTRFSRAMLKDQPAFATIAVTDRAYYFALPPDEAMMAFADDQKAPDQLARVLSNWWNEHGKPAVDAQAATPLEQSQLNQSRGSNSVYELSAEQRKGMWRTVADASKERDGDSLGLIPVIMQPPLDQPEDARLAFAINEHARLWSLKEMSDDSPVAPSAPAAPVFAGNQQDSTAKVREVPAYDPGTAPPDAQIVRTPQPEVVTPANPEAVFEPETTTVYRNDPVVVYGDDVDVDVEDGVVVVETDNDFDAVETVYAPPVYSGYTTYSTVFGYPAYAYPYVSYCAPIYPVYRPVWCGPRYYPALYAGGCYNGFYGSVGVGGFGFAFGWRDNDCYRYAPRAVAYGGGCYGGGRIYAHGGRYGPRPTPYGVARNYSGNRYYGSKSGNIRYGNNGVVRNSRENVGGRGLYGTGQRGLYSSGNRGLYPRNGDPNPARGGNLSRGTASVVDPSRISGSGRSVRDLLRNDVSRRGDATGRSAGSSTGNANRSGAIRNLTGRENRTTGNAPAARSAPSSSGNATRQWLRDSRSGNAGSSGSATPRSGGNRPIFNRSGSGSSSSPSMHQPMRGDSGRSIRSAPTNTPRSGVRSAPSAAPRSGVRSSIGNSGSRPSFSRPMSGGSSPSRSAFRGGNSGSSIRSAIGGSRGMSSPRMGGASRGGGGGGRGAGRGR